MNEDLLFVICRRNDISCESTICPGHPIEWTNEPGEALRYIKEKNEHFWLANNPDNFPINWEPYVVQIVSSINDSAF